jgi:ATP-dependent RNA helicase RhlE
MTFAQFGLAAPLLRAVSAQGYSIPTPIQVQAIPHVLAGSDLLGCAQTGTGKTAAFALPVLHRLTCGVAAPRERGRPIRVLVLSPTRELAAQIVASFEAYGSHTPLRYAVVYGGVSQRPQVDSLRRGVDILVATPGRLVDLINQRLVALNRVETFILDEADRMLDMGFLPDLRRIKLQLPTQRQTLLFSATIPDTIRQLANSLLREPVRLHIAPVESTTALIAESVCFVPQRAKHQLLTDLLAERDVVRALVFTRTKHTADRVARQLNKTGVRAEAMHGNKSQSARQRTLAGFKSNRPPVLVATDLAARGIDVDGITHVFNFDLPHEPETYVHRIGRTGRAGATGTAVSFCDHQERRLLQAIERFIDRKLLVDQTTPVDVIEAVPPRQPVSAPTPKRPAAPRRSRTARPHGAVRTGRAPAKTGRRW